MVTSGRLTILYQTMKLMKLISWMVEKVDFMLQFQSSFLNWNNFYNYFLLSTIYINLFYARNETYFVTLNQNKTKILKNNFNSSMTIIKIFIIIIHLKVHGHLYINIGIKIMTNN
jgi:hypothetical protein